MTWFKVDDTFAYHAKTTAAGNAAIGLWTRAGSWSMQQLSDGYIPEAVALTLGTKTQINKLVEVGLWKTAPDGYQFHEWAGRQPSAQTIQLRRADWRHRQRKYREPPD
jgi:hypothetical protein